MQLMQLSEAQIEARFHIVGPQAVAFLLAGMAKDEVRFTVHFGEEMFMTTLLAANVARDELIFDCGGSTAVNRRFLYSMRNVFIARPGGVHVQFVTGAAREIMYAGLSAFAVTLPERVLRLQRREYFRIDLPRARPVDFFARLPDGHLLTLPMHNISVGGLAVTVAEKPAELMPGMVLANCHCALPGDDRELFFSATIRHISEEEMRNGIRFWRIGMQFNGLSPADEVRIQRFIARVERERHELT